MQNPIVNHHEQLRLNLIEQEERVISVYLIELANADEKHWRTKETKALLEDSINKRNELIKHYTETFNKSYNTELNQATTKHKVAESMHEQHLNEDFRVASMLSHEEAKELSDHYAKLAETFKEELEQLIQQNIS